MDFLDGWIQGDGNNIQVGLWRTYDLSFGVITLAQKWTISFRKGRKGHTQNNHDNFTLHFCFLVLYIWAHALLECTLSWAHAFLSSRFLERTLSSTCVFERTLSGAHAFFNLRNWAHAFLSARFIQRTLFFKCTLSWEHSFWAHSFWVHSLWAHSLWAHSFWAFLSHFQIFFQVTLKMVWKWLKRVRIPKFRL